MAMEKASHYENMWDMISNYTFQIDAKLLKCCQCAICKGLLRNSYEAPCGCSFCFECIKVFLQENNDNVKFCPSSGKNCKLKPISLEINLKKVNSLDKKISELKVNCPLKFCNYETELIKLSDHIITCNKRIVSCPYKAVGCCQMDSQNEIMSTHLLKECNNHNNQLIQFVSVNKEQVDRVIHKQDIIKNKLSQLENDVKVNQDKFFSMIQQREQENLTNNYDKNELQILKSTINELKCEIRSNNEKEREEFTQWKQNFQTSLERLHEEFITPCKTKRKRKWNNNNSKQSIDQFSATTVFLFKEPSCAEYEWNIDYWPDLDRRITTEKFYSNDRNFEMKLEMSQSNLSGAPQKDLEIKFFIKIHNTNSYAPNEAEFAVDIKLNLIGVTIMIKSFKINIFKNYHNTNSFLIPISNNADFLHHSLLIKCNVEIK